MKGVTSDQGRSTSGRGRRRVSLGKRDLSSHATLIPEYHNGVQKEDEQERVTWKRGKVRGHLNAMRNVRSSGNEC